MSQGIRVPLEARKSKETDSPLDSLERNIALPIPSFYSSETLVGLLTYNTVR